MRHNRVTVSYVSFILLVVFSIIPNVGITVSTMGFTWTAYRLVIVLSAAILALSYGKIKINKDDPMTKWILFMTVWSFYGMVLLFVGPYSDLHNGFIEWLSIFSGLIVFCCMSWYLSSEKYLNTALKLVYWLLNFLLVVGFIEILTGRHWIASAFNDFQSTIFLYSNHHLATGFMYNMNDFSALLTCMSPVLILRQFGKKRVVTLGGVITINFINDATTCNAAIMVFALYYCLILWGGKTQKAIALRILFWALLIMGLVITLRFGTNYSERNDFVGAIARQISNARHANGSLYRRIVMYKDAITACLSTGMMGLGPAGFSNYFSVHPSMSKLVNPHAMVFEVLAQYGIVICGWFVWLLARMLRSAKKMYYAAKEQNKERALIVVAFVIVYFVASFAPSSFVGYSYQWMLIAIMCSQLYFIRKQEGW